jgi:hypothetical protein
MKSYRVSSNGDLIDESTGKPYLPGPSAVVQVKGGRREQVQEITESRADREQQQKPTVKTRLCEAYRSLGLSIEEAEIAAGMAPSRRDQGSRLVESYRGLGLSQEEAEIAAGVRKPPSRTDSWGL